MKERPQPKKYNKLGNGLIDLSNCYYVIETYVNKEQRSYQSIMFNYNDDNERNYYRSVVSPELKMLRREYFDKKGKLIFLEDFKHA